MPVSFDDLLPAKNQPTGNPSGGSLAFDDLIPGSQAEQPSMIADVLKSAGSGIARGTADLMGLPGTIGDAFNNGMSYVTGMPRLPQNPVSGETLRNAASTVTGGATDYAPQTTAGEYAATAGEFVPGALAFGGGTIGSALKYGVVPGLASEGAGQMTKGTEYEPYARVAAAMLAPAALSAGQRLITPFPTSPERIVQANTLAGEGVDLTAGQRTGNNSLRYMESEIGGTSAANMMERQGEQFTRAALQRAGVNAERATPEVIDDAFRRIGADFDGLAARNTLLPDAQMGQDLGNVFREYNGAVAQSQRAPVVADLIGDITTRASQGPIDGNFYQRTSSRLATLARSAATDPERRQALQGMRDALDDAMERSLQATNPADLGGWQQARNQYRNMLVLEKAATGAGENSAMGIISPQQLRGAVVNQGRRAYARGQGDFADLARAGEATMRPLPNSGTASRLNARSLGTGTLGLLGTAAGAGAGGPVGAVAGALAGAAIPSAVGSAILSRGGRAYLSNQLLGQTNVADPRYAAVVEALLSRMQSHPREGR